MSSDRLAATVLLCLLIAVPTFAQNGGAGANLAASPLAPAAAGFRLPLDLHVVNSSSGDARSLRVSTNQLFRYQLDDVIPAGQAARVDFAPWYFDGPLSLADVRSTTESGRTVQSYLDSTLEVPSIARRSVVLLYDRSRLRAETLEPHLAEWTSWYAAASLGAATPVVQLQPADLSAPRLDRFADSPVVGIVVSPDVPAYGDLVTQARDVGLDLWAVRGSSLTHPVVVPPLLHQLSRQGDVRRDVLNFGFEQPTRIADVLFQLRDWPASERIRFVVPPIVMAAVLLCLGMLARRLPRVVKVIVVLVVAAASLGWTLALVRITPLRAVDAVCITWVDGQTGQTWTDRLAAVACRRPGRAEIHFDRPGAGQPRPIVVAEVDRTVYRDALLHRDPAARWSVEEVDIRPGMLLAFAADHWNEVTFPGGSRLVYPQSSGPEVRLTDRAALEDVWAFVGGRAWPAAGAKGVYRRTGPATSAEGAAFDVAAPADLFRRRAMRWLARNYVLPGRVLVFGWRDEPAGVSSPGAVVYDHGRLMVWMLPSEPSR